MSLPQDHVIIDKKELEEIILFFNDRPELVDLIGTRALRDI